MGGTISTDFSRTSADLGREETAAVARCIFNRAEREPNLEAESKFI